MPSLVLGPLLRHVGRDGVTVWVETDAPCTVEVLGQRARTFAVGGHHYAVVIAPGLPPGSQVEYGVALDGRPVWPPPGTPYPPSVVRTPVDGAQQRVVWGSCRAALPHHPPYTWSKARSPEGRETDALWALAERVRVRPPDEWPDLLLHVGDQVYADENTSPEVQAYFASRRDTSRPPGGQASDFEEFCTVYRVAWSDPTIRWLLSTVPSAMIFDDHDVHDDWNTSAAWRDEIRREPWWQARLEGALMSYWLYQHLGNLAPDELRADPTFRALCALPPGEDGEELLRRFAWRSDIEDAGRKDAHWSYARTIGDTRLVVVDSRAGRILAEDRRSMLDEDEWHWLEQQLAGGPRHVLVVTSLPYLLPPALHHLEAWNEAVCGGRWGRWAARAGERLRQRLDLEHWAAFERSSRRLAGLLRGLATGARGPRPASVTLLSGDVHFSYLAEAAFPDAPGAAPVHQVVCSPLRNALSPRVRRVAPLMRSRPLAAVARGLAAAAGVPPPPLRWRLAAGPWFDNTLSTLVVGRGQLLLGFEAAPPTDGEPVLHRLHEQPLT